VALRSSALGDRATSTVDPDLAAWEPVRKALWDPPDPLGDKHADVVRTSWGRLLVSAAPVKLDEAVVGVIAISLPLQEVATRLSQEAGSRGITLYDQTGTALESTLRVSSQSLAALQVAVTDRERVLTTDQILFRRAQVGSVQYVEALSVLAVRQRPVLLMGVGNLVAIIEERGQQARSMLVAIFSGVVMVVLAVGIAIARRLTRPVHALVEATRRVRNNQLDFDVPVETEDEHGLLTAAFNDMRGGLIERERSREAIERYMSPKVYELIQTGELSMGGSRREITVFKSDIRDFTSLSEQMEPEQIVAYLNRYFERMVKPIADRAGEVDKYMGDSILAKFGATVWYPDHARRAVLAMVEIAEACEALNRELAAEGLPTVYTRVGANTGDAVVGNIGSTQRLEYTIISDTVNVAQRVEELGKDVGWDLLISEQTYAQASDAVEVGEPWAVRLRGRTQDTLVYPVLGRSGAVPAGRRRAYQQLLRSASGTAGERRRETDARLAPTPQPPRSA
jgi:adenylate cyclase